MRQRFPDESSGVVATANSPLPPSLPPCLLRSAGGSGSPEFGYTNQSIAPPGCTGTPRSIGDGLVHPIPAPAETPALEPRPTRPPFPERTAVRPGNARVLRAGFAPVLPRDPARRSRDLALSPRCRRRRRAATGGPREGHGIQAAIALPALPGDPRAGCEGLLEGGEISRARMHPRACTLPVSAPADSVDESRRRWRSKHGMGRGG